MDTEPHDKSYFEDLFVHRGTGGLNDYWNGVSFGKVNLDGSEVFDWTPFPKTRDEFDATPPARSDRIDGAVEAAGINRDNYAGVVAIFNISVGDAGGGVLAGPGEYFDSLDIMSAMNVSAHQDSRFNQSGPLLCTGNQDRMGWLPANRIWSPPQYQSSINEVDPVSLGHPEVPGFISIMASTPMMAGMLACRGPVW